jgi:hypothetical protein
MSIVPELPRSPGKPGYAQPGDRLDPNSAANSHGDWQTTDGRQRSDDQQEANQHQNRVPPGVPGARGRGIAARIRRHARSREGQCTDGHATDLHVGKHGIGGIFRFWNTFTAGYRRAGLRQPQCRPGAGNALRQPDGTGNRDGHPVRALAKRRLQRGDPRGVPAATVRTLDAGPGGTGVPGRRRSTATIARATFHRSQIASADSAGSTPSGDLVAARPFPGSADSFRFAY